NTDSTVLRDQEVASKKAEQMHIHFHELISDSDKGVGLSMNILSTFIEIARRLGHDDTVFFESTNLSSTYIPAIIQKQIEHTDKIEMKRDISMLGKLCYSYATLK